MQKSYTIKKSPKSFQQNVEIWSQFDPKHAVNLQFLDTEDYEFCKTEQGELNLRKKTEDGFLYFHDNDGAQKEADQWFSKLDLDKSQLLYVYGAGIGYSYLALQKWLKADRKRNVVFIEDDLGVIAKLCETNIGSKMLRDRQVEICYFQSLHQHKDPLRLLYWKYQNKSFGVESSPLYKKIKNETMQDLSHYLVFEATINSAVLDEYYKLGIIFYRNFYHILLRLKGCYSANGLFEKFQGVPAIICGAGPSLGKHFDQLRTLGTHALIFAGGSALNALNSAGIMPHLGVGIDPNPAQYERYITNGAYELPFIFGTRLNNRAFDILHGPKLLLTGSEGYAAPKYFAERLGFPIEELEEGYNVIHLIIELAAKMGCNPIILVGMDLGFTDMKSYAPGIIVDAAISEKTIAEKTVHDEIPFLKKDINGKPLYTLWKWIAESDWTEKWANNHPDIKLINATEGGLGFGSVPNASLKDAMKDALRNQDDYLSLIHGYIENNSLEYSLKKTKEEIKKLKASLKRCINLLKILIDESRVMKQMVRNDELDDTLSTGTSILAETELAEEDGYSAVISDFNTVYNMIMQDELIQCSLLRSEKRKNLKKVQIREKKYRFLREAARANILAMDWALKEHSYL